MLFSFLKRVLTLQGLPITHPLFRLTDISVLVHNWPITVHLSELWIRISEFFKSVHWNRILILTMHYTAWFFAKAWNILWLLNKCFTVPSLWTDSSGAMNDIWENMGTRLLLWLTLLCGYRAANRQRGFNQNLLTNEQLLQSCYYYFCVTLKTTKNQRGKSPFGSQLTSRCTR